MLGLVTLQLGPVKDIHEGNTGLLGELLMSQDLLQERLFDGLPGAAPETVLTSGLGDHHPAQSVLRRRSAGQSHEYRRIAVDLLKEGFKPLINLT